QLAWGLNLPFRDIQPVRWGMPERGEVVLFHNPHDAGNVWMKRIVGLPGDRLEFREHRLYVNGIACTLQQRRFEQLPRSNGTVTAPYRIWHSYLEADWGPLVVGEASMFVMGDNRGASMDSRSWGPVPLAYLLGKPLLHLWPLPLAQLQPGVQVPGAQEAMMFSDKETRISNKEGAQ
ncbi:MAG: signal peptidase I, partial [Mariprofundaceae bacterium]|nr:signal peptidase I [Mariprofundaceae bacterium]